MMMFYCKKEVYVFYIFLYSYEEAIYVYQEALRQQSTDLGKDIRQFLEQTAIDFPLMLYSQTIQ